MESGARMWYAGMEMDVELLSVRVDGESGSACGMDWTKLRRSLGS